ncbi:MAG: response regulator [Alphaproteobacteria bacterium]|nr:response regulator [Alphaproteobacteria bacterium]MCB9792812.1 response regulator [Alphaproteobacteria bacterium]
MSSPPPPPPLPPAPETRRLRAALDALPELVISFDSRGRVADVNRFSQRLLGCSQAELQRRPSRMLDLLPHADRVWLQQSLRQAVNGETLSGSMSVNGPAGLVRLTVQLLPLRDDIAKAEPLQPVVVLRGQPVAEGRAPRPQAPSGPLSEYGLITASLVHDLNNALSVLANSLDTVSLELPTFVRELASDALSTCRSVSEDLKSLSEGAGGLQSRVVRMSPLLEQVVDELREAGSALPLISLHDELGDASCMADAAALARVMRELGARARRVKATSLEIRAKLLGDKVLIEFTDDGLGMSEEQVQRIARPHLPDGSRRRLFDFPVLRGVARAYGGELSLRSRPDLGSSFLLTLPASARPLAPTREALPPLPKTILVVEDDPELRRSLTWLLRAREVIVFTAGEGQEALSVLADNPRIQLVLLDLAMPGVDGLSTLHRMRERGDTRPVIMMSGYADEAQAAECQALGALGFLGKPFRIRELQALLSDPR